MRRGAAVRATAIAAAAGAIAAAAVAGRARAYVRTADHQTGVAVSWPLPVATYELSSASWFRSPGCMPPPDQDPAELAVRASFAAWEQGCSDLKLVYGGPTPEIRTGLGGTAENVVVVRRGFCSQNPAASQDPCMADPDVDCAGIYDCFEDHGPGDWSIVALTTVLYDPGTGRLFDADMELNGWDGTPGTIPTAGLPQHGYYFTCDTQPGRATCATYGQPGCNGYDLQNTVTHEAGHFVGLAHPCGDPGMPSCSATLPTGEIPYAQRTMYPGTTIGEISKRTLSADDVAGVCAIYPAQGGGCGCGSGGAPGALAALLAALALRPRVRRR